MKVLNPETRTIEHDGFTWVNAQDMSIQLALLCLMMGVLETPEGEMAADLALGIGQDLAELSGLEGYKP